MAFCLFHLLFFLFHLSIFITNATAVLAQSCSHSQKSALLTLFSNPSSLPSWKSDGSDCCHWEGVTCDQSTGHVTILDVANRSISSSINSTAFTSLSSLRILNLSNNNFNSPIPSDLDSLSNLTHLNLSDSSFTSQIPLAISRLKNLVSLDISTTFDRQPLSSLKLEDPDLAKLVQNLSLLEEIYLDGVHISSQVPEFLSNFTGLRHIHLSFCGLLGVFPGTIFQLPKLQVLDVSDNYLLNGSIPEFSQESDLRELVLAATRFSSRLPDSFGYLKKLTKLHLATCAFSGSIPSSMRNITGLVYLYLSNNRFSGTILPLENLTQLIYLDLSVNSFTGPISPLAKLTKLSRLDLFSNNFTGPISPLVKLTKLSHLDLSWNPFSGQIPLLHSLKNIREILLSKNNFTGTISVNGLQNLEVLYVSGNSLYGKIPSDILSLPSLWSLDLSQNHFNGSLDEFDNASQMLEFIDLSKNNLQGQIPRSVFRHPRLGALLLSSNNFSGTVKIAKLQNLKYLSDLDLSDNLLSIDFLANSSLSFPSFERLQLRSCNLTKFPDFLRNQSKLEYLDLSNNKIHGEIPSWIWTVGDGYLTQLNLSFNLLTSSEQSQNLSSGSLLVIDLHSNKLQGSIPLPQWDGIMLDYSDNNFTSLPSDSISYFNFTIFFSISGNNVIGEIPESICSASYLEVLDLSNNRLRGSIPKCLGEMTTVLSVLDLRNNNLSGTIPEIFRMGCTLRTLNLNGNQFHGKLPGSLRNCRELDVLDLGSNQISDLIPSYLDSLSKLRILVLRANKFHGTIIQFDNFTLPMLQIMDISSNNLSGKLPEAWFKTLAAMTSEEDSQIIGYQFLQLSGLYYQDRVMVTNKGLNMELVKIMTIFTSLDLSNNNFEGMIPKVLGALNSLHVLNMSHNDFTGSIPASMGNLRQLESLDLSQNKLSGEIPSQLTRLTFLSVLNLSYNRLQGSIPQEGQFLTFANGSFIGNPGLYRLPLSKECKGAKVSRECEGAKAPSIEAPEPRSNNNINWFLISVEVGFFVGLGAVVVPLLFWKKWSRWCFRQVDKMLEKFS